jgi:RNA polymerase sigma factor (sigma-70 family)
MYFTRSFIQYTKELSNSMYIPLTREEEKQTLIELGSGSTSALNKLINAHLRFVVYSLRDFKTPSYIDPMDLVQEGNLGLIDALSRFDISMYNCRVATYAQYYIRWYIRTALGLYDKDVVIHNSSENFNLDEVESLTPKEEEAIYQDILKYVKTFLTERESKIISLLFGLEYPFTALTLREVGSLVHLDPERVRQIKKEALEQIKLRKSEIEILK